jgi:hypothetical protein
MRPEAFRGRLAEIALQEGHVAAMSLGGYPCSLPLVNRSGGLARHRQDGSAGRSRRQVPAAG